MYKGLLQKKRTWDIFVSSLLWIFSLLTLSSVTMFVSWKTWYGRTVHSNFRGILQSQIKGLKPEPCHFYLLANQFTSSKSICKFIYLSSSSQSICNPCLIAHNSVELFVVLLLCMENHIIYPFFKSIPNHNLSSCCAGISLYTTICIKCDKLIMWRVPTAK